MINTIFKNNRTLDKIKDPTIKQIVQDFFVAAYKQGVTFRRNNIDVMDKHYTYKLNLVGISKVFAEMSLEELNSNICIKLMPTDSNIRRAYYLFWIYLYENNYIADPLVKRLVDFKEIIFQRNLSPSNVETIFNDPTYSTLLTSRLPKFLGDEHSDAFALYFFDPELDDIKDHHVKDVLVNHFNNLRYNEEYAIGSLRGVQLMQRKIAKYIFEKFLPEELTCHDIASATRSKELKGINPSHYVNLLYELIQNGILFNEDLKAAVLFLYDKPQVVNSVFIDILNSSHPDRWALLKQTDTIKPKRNRSLRFVYLNHHSNMVRETLSAFFIGYGYNDKEIKFICENFEESLKPHNVDSLTDFNFKTYQSQLYYFKDLGNNNKRYYQFITAFYAYIWRNHNTNIFKGDFIDPKVLLRANIGWLLTNGFEIINYTPAENVPTCDKWILCYEDMIQSNSMIKNGLFNILVDFSTVECSLYRDYLKQWYWEYKADLDSKNGDLRNLTTSFNYIYQLKKGNELSIFTKPSDDLTISINDIVAWKNWIINTNNNNRTINHKIYAMRKAIFYLNEKEICKFESGVFYHLTYTLNQDYDNAKPLSNEELSKLASVLKEEAEKSIFGKLCYSAFYIALETEFRPTQIFSLKRDCVSETAKKNEYIITAVDKTSAGEPTEFPITEYVKREIDEIKAATDSYRNDITSLDLREYLFITTRQKRGHFKLITPEAFNTHIKKCCDIAGIDRYTISNLRDTHMTKAEEEIIRKSLSTMHMQVLTGHKNPKSDLPYIKSDVRTMLEAAHGVIIGNVDADGCFVENTTPDMIKENEVSNSCGYCTSSNCDDFSYLDCMLCKHFITTTNRLPYFYEQLKKVDCLLVSASIPHDKDDLVNIKRLLLYYIEKILVAKEKLENDKEHIN